MATVYRAFDPATEREVAVKVLPPQFAHDPTFVGRFQREARTVARLDHLHIVPIYDVGVENDQPYLVMRLLTGGSLHDRLAREGALSPAQILPILNHIADALDEAHAQGIIHRDLKPSNILFDRRGAAFVSDFGIAKVMASATAYTGTGIIGTPEYMSPEQARAMKELDPRSDVYSLAVMVFEMLTGQLPYKADTPMGLAMAHVLEPVPSLRQVNPGVSKAVDAVVQRALAKEPPQRYASASEFVADLQAAIGQRPAPNAATVVEAPPPVMVTAARADAPGPSTGPGSGGVPATGVQRRRPRPMVLGAVAGVGALGLCLLAGAGGLFVFRENLGAWIAGARPPARTATGAPPAVATADPAEAASLIPLEPRSPNNTWMPAASLIPAEMEEFESSSVTNRELADASADPEATLARLLGWGRYNGYATEYRHKLGCEVQSGYLNILVQTILFNTIAGAETALEWYYQEDRRLGDRIEPHNLGNEGYQVWTVGQSPCDPPHSMRTVGLFFRRANALAGANVSAVKGAVPEDQMLVLAGRLAAALDQELLSQATP
jgi:serine/threonine-protein kinase